MSQPSDRRAMRNGRNRDARTLAFRRPGSHQRARAFDALWDKPRRPVSANSLHIALPSPGRAESATLETRLRRLRRAEDLARCAGELGRNFRVGFGLADEMGESAAEVLRVCNAPLHAAAQGPDLPRRAGRRNSRRH